MAQRKPRVRTPKLEKIKTEEEGTVGRKRKKSLKEKETPVLSEEAGPAAEEVDSITATIEAVLANTSAINTALDKPKKAKRVKKQDQEGDMVKTSKQDAETTAADDDENDDDSSTAGN